MRDVTAVDEKHLTIDLRCAIGCEVGNERCDIAGLPRQFVGLRQCAAFDHHLLDVSGYRCNHPRLGSRRDAVCGDAVLAQIFSQHFGETCDAALRRAVVGLSDRTDQARSGRERDNSTTALLPEYRRGMSDHRKGALHMHGNYVVPLLFSHVVEHPIA